MRISGAFVAVVTPVKCTVSLSNVLNQLLLNCRKVAELVPP